MASLQSKLVRLLLRLTAKRPLQKTTNAEEVVSTLRRVFQRSDKPNLKIPPGVSIEEVDDGGVRGEWIVANGARPHDRVVLHVHGGGFIACLPLTYRQFTIAIARRTGAAVFSVDYRRAPEARYPAALDDAIAAYDRLRETYAPEAIVLVGDSAGGNLVLALTLALRARGDATPVAGVVALSPVTDLRATSPSFTSNAKSDDLLVSEGFADAMLLYAGDADLDDPLVSPINGDYAGFPPLFVTASTTEILRDDTQRLVDRARAAGVPVEFVLEADLPHVWPIMPLMPESKREVERIAAFATARWARTLAATA